MAHHVEHHQFFAAVVDVLHHHAVFLSALSGIDNLPALLNRERHWHLNKGMFAALHGFDCHRRVPFPRGRNNHNIDIIAAQQIAIAQIITSIDSRFGPILFNDMIYGSVEYRLMGITNGFEFNAL